MKGRCLLISGSQVRVLLRPPPTRRILGVQFLGRANRRVSAGFAQFAANINGAETALAAFLRPIRPEVSVGEFRDPFFGPLMVQFGQTGQAGKPRRRR